MKLEKAFSKYCGRTPHGFFGAYLILQKVFEANVPYSHVGFLSFAPYSNLNEQGFTLATRFEQVTFAYRASVDGGDWVVHVSASSGGATATNTTRFRPSFEEGLIRYLSRNVVRILKNAHNEKVGK